MIRPFTCICALLAAGSGLYLYQTKHRTRLLDEHIGAIVHQVDQAHQRVAMLRAEWALLNTPDRLSDLAGRYLPDLKQLAPTQFVALADLDKRLPPVGPPPGSTPDTSAAPDAAGLPTIPAVPVPMARTDPAPPARDADARVALKAPADRPAPDHAADHAAPDHKPDRVARIAPEPDADRADAPPAREAARVAPRPVPHMAEIARARPPRDFMPRPYAPPREMPVAQRLPETQSVLGNTRSSLPPPVPVASSGFDSFPGPR